MNKEKYSKIQDIIFAFENQFLECWLNIGENIDYDKLSKCRLKCWDELFKLFDN